MFQKFAKNTLGFILIIYSFSACKKRLYGDIINWEKTDWFVDMGTRGNDTQLEVTLIQRQECKTGLWTYPEEIIVQP